MENEDKDACLSLKVYSSFKCSQIPKMRYITQVNKFVFSTSLHVKISIKNIMLILVDEYRIMFTWCR